ncbi:Autophagy protein [Taphrina deformans PYCC 5710]|uniref:Autophagy protein 5 n=1 Tax=Taphrina deformans (strain PYCC 5710 / ATCC 11124 / CBS 356.35 / IMI 108563 / JCM 9778 / NBRC 8474) TaxID=1097556 RepID=R4X8W6_TAPDE|nr:Autophagy protein [Taphrina deformans PYCC 5710]|eukprot:CCG82099.1 Autophagy protein [Taphrina deformans PYCC 5710]
MATSEYAVPTDVAKKFKYEERLNNFDSVRLRTWRSTVSIRFVYENSGASSLDLEIPRLTFLPLTFPKLREYFSLRKDYNIALTTRNNEVVANHLPVGLLYDLYGELAVVPSNAFLQGFLRCQTLHDVSTSVWNAMKQNEFLRRYSIRRIQNLTPEQHERLETAFLNLTLSAYIEASQTLMNLQGLRYVPVRLYLTPTHAIQDLITPKIEGNASTISHVMKKLAPELSNLGPVGVDVIIHGIVIEWQIKLVDLLDEATYVDGWLYLTIKKSTLPTSTVTTVEDVRDSNLAQKDDTRPA